MVHCDSDPTLVATGGRVSEYYNKLKGTSRQWGDICYYFGYLEDNRELIMVDRDEIPPKLLEGDQAADARVKLAQQVKLLAFRAGIPIVSIAQFLDVVRRNFDYWCVGDKVPNEEHYQALLKLKEGLNSGEITKENIATRAKGRAKPEPSQSHLEPTILEEPSPTTPTPPKVSDKKRVKKGNDPPSRSPHDTEAHCHEFLKNDVSLDDESIVKKANPACAKCPLRERPYVPGWGEEGRGLVIIPLPRELPQ